MISPVRKRQPQADRSPRPGPEGWVSRSARSVEDMGQVIEDITGAMTRQSFRAEEVFGMRLAVEEAVVNAMKHGHKDCPDEPVSVRYQVSPERVLVEVEDRGPGFDPDQVADPLAPENLERPSGRGLLLMRTYTTWMRHNRRGNRVTLCKRKSRAKAQAR